MKATDPALYFDENQLYLMHFQTQVILGLTNFNSSNILSEEISFCSFDSLKSCYNVLLEVIFIKSFLSKLFSVGPIDLTKSAVDCGILFDSKMLLLDFS